MQKFPLSVRPVKKHKNPRYPGWQDPNPLDHPEAAPYPFSKKVLRFLTAAGFAGAAFSSCTDEKNGHENGISDDALHNVFTFEKHGLPYRIPAFGSGQPENLNRRYALSILEKLTKKEGFDMQKGHVFESGEFKIPLDGWDSLRRTGYVVLDWINSEDCFASDFYFSLPIIRIYENDTTGEANHLREFGSWSDAWDFYEGNFPDNETNHQMQWAYYEPVSFPNKRFWSREFPTLEDGVRQKLEFLKIVVPIELKDSEWDEKKDEIIERHVFPKLEKLLKELSISPDLQKRIELYEDFEKARRAISATFQYKHMEKHWISAFSNSNRAERQQKIGKLIRLFFLTRRNEALEERIEKAFADPKKDPLETFAAELEAFDRSTISLAELHELDRLAASGEAFVMPVSSHDARFYYNSWHLPEDWGGPYSETDPPPALFDWLEFHQKRQGALPDSLRNEHKKWHEKDVLDALSELERQARHYLRWAKSQGF